MLEVAEHALDEIALAIGGLVERIMSAAFEKKAGRPSLSYAALGAKQPPAGTALVNAVATRTSPRWPGVASTAMGRPRAPTMAWIFVVRPPRERPIACAGAPLFRPPPSGGPWPSYCRWLDPSPGSARASASNKRPRSRGSSSGESDCKLSSTARRRPGNPASDSQFSERERCR
jgi:hypothetical protein